MAILLAGSVHALCRLCMTSHNECPLPALEGCEEQVCDSTRHVLDGCSCSVHKIQRKRRMRQNAIHLNQTPLEPPPKRTKAEQHLYQDVTIEEDSVQPTAREETYLQLICVYAANTSTNAIEAIGAGKLSGNE
jgi:hypothetical protein